MAKKIRLTLPIRTVSLLVVGSIVALGAALPARAADVRHGAKVFRSQCAECHSTKAGKNKTGPSLFGVVGRRAGSVPRYVYSKAMKNSGLTWTEERLDGYLTAPRKAVPGCKMKYRGLKDRAARADLIAFLHKTR